MRVGRGRKCCRSRESEVEKKGRVVGLGWVEWAWVYVRREGVLVGGGGSVGMGVVSTGSVA